MQTLQPFYPVAVLFVLTSVLAFVVIGASSLLGPRRGSKRITTAVASTHGASLCSCATA